MPWTRRRLLTSTAACLAPGVVAPGLGVASGLLTFGVAVTGPVALERRELLGEWKDEKWRRVAWRIIPGGTPGELTATRFPKEGAAENFRGSLVRVADRYDILDLTPAAARAPGEVAPHLLLRLEVDRVRELTVGNPRRMRKEFGNNPAKSYLLMTLRPLKSSRVRDLPDAPKIQPDASSGSAGRDVVVSATTAQVAEFLARYGKDSDNWKAAHDGTKLVRRPSEQES